MDITEEDMSGDVASVDMRFVEELHNQVKHYLKVKCELRELIETAKCQNWDHTKYYLEKALEALEEMD